MINALHPCLLALLPVLHPQPRTGLAKVVENHSKIYPSVLSCYIIQPNRATEVFDALLRSIQLESKIVSRKVDQHGDVTNCLVYLSLSPTQAYLSHVASYIEMMGIYSTRHLKVSGN